MGQVFVRVYAELNDYLPLDRRMQVQPLVLGDDATVLTVLETAQIPEDAVDLVLVNGEPVASSHLLADGDRVSIYPVFESFDIRSVTKTREQPLRVTRFVLDVHLGKLGSFLRMLGFDTLYERVITDEELVRLSVSEQRLLLSRDRALVESGRLTRAYAVRETDPHRQLTEVLRRFDLGTSVRPFSRCMRCNATLSAVPKDAVIEQLPQKTAAFYNEFVRCPRCGQVYWRGSHYRRMARFIDRILDEVAAGPQEHET